MRTHHPNYEKENYCATCDIKYPKSVLWCKNCGMRVRGTPHSGKRRAKYLMDKPRI